METRWVWILTLASLLWVQTNAQDQEEADVAIALHVAKNVKIKIIKNYLHPFLSDLVQATDVDSGAVRFSITVFGPDSEVQFGFNKFNTAAKLKKAIKRLKPKFIRKPAPDAVKLFETLTSSVFTEASGDRPQVPNILILITDQKSSGKAQVIQDKADELKATGTQIFTIGLRRADKKEIKRISSDPTEDNSYYIAAHADLENDDLKNKLGESIYAFRNLKITTQPPPTTTTKTTTTETQTTTFTTTTPTTTTTTQPTTTTTEETTTTSGSFVWPLSGSEEADIVIALHLSPRTTEFEFMMAINYLLNLIDGVDVETGRVQIGLMYYNADAEVIFHINQYTSMEDIWNVVRSISPDKRSFLVDASSAIGLARQMLSSYFNRREWVPAALIFITDASSTENADLVVSERERAQQDGLNIYSIGINLRDKSELEMLATAPENVMTVSRVQELDTTIDEIKRKMFAFRTRVVPTDTPGRVRTVPMPSEEPPIRITLPSSRVGKKLPDEMYIGDERNRIRGASNQRCGVIELDLVILLDSSTSVTERNFKKMLNATKRFVAAEDIDIDNGLVRVAVVIYSNTAEPQFYLNTYSKKRHILRAFDKIQFTYGRTNITGALKLMRTDMFSREKGDRADVPNVGIIVTDGVSTIENKKTVPEADLARLGGIRIFGIGVGLTNTSELEGIAGDLENVYTIDHFDDLELKMDNLYQSICPVVISDVPQFLPSSKESCRQAELDVVFLLDVSSTIGETNFKRLISAVKEFINNSDMDSGATRIGIVTHSSRVYIKFHLNEYSAKRGLMKAVDEIPYIRGTRNTADGIKIMREEMFSFNYGDRRNVPNFAIIITDGISKRNRFEAIPEAEMSREAEIELFVVGVGVRETNELNEIAGGMKNRILTDKFEELSNKLSFIQDSICTVTESPTLPQLTCADTDETDIVFVVDSSTSVGPANFETMLNAVKSFVNDIDIDSGKIQIGLLTYNTGTYVQFHLQRYKTKSEILQAIDRVEYKIGSTNTADAITVARTRMFSRRHGARKDANYVMIVITDGISNINYDKVLPESELARSEGIVTLAVGVGVKRTKEIDIIAGIPENRLVIQRFDQLQEKLKTLFASICDVSDSKKDIHLMTCGESELDIVFILDSSTSVSNTDFDKMLNVTKVFLDGTNIDDDKVRVGVVLYSTRVVKQFYLNSYNTKAEVMRAISDINRMLGDTNIADAIQMIRETMFTSRNGDRPNVPNVAIIITDGISNINSRRTIPEADKAKDDDIRIFAIGVGVEDDTELDNIASFPLEDNRISIKDFDELHWKMDVMYLSLCPGKLIHNFPELY